MPEWTLWLVPCVFTVVFACTIAREALLACPARTAGLPSCPSRHRDAVPVEDVEGELVAWLCVDPVCGEQLPKDWRFSISERSPQGPVYCHTG